MNKRIRNSKTTFGVIVLLGASALILICAASAQDGGATTAGEPVSAPDNRRVTPLDANSSAVEWVEQLTNAMTGEVTTRPHNYVTVGTGINYVDDSGQLRASEDFIELTEDGGAAALRAPHKIRFNANLNNGPAPITLTTVSNRVFRSHPRGLYYVNLQTGEYALVAPVQNSIGELHPPNQLIYPDCLAGGLVKGDYRVTCTKAAAEADLILLTQLPPPELFFGTVNPQAVRLEWVTEFLDAPTPKIRTRILKRQTDATLRQTMTEPDLVDDTLDFADLWFPLGRAFVWDGSTNSDATTPAQIQIARQGSDTNQVLVAKRWVQDEQRNLLVESVDWLDIAPKLAALPQAGRVAHAPELKDRVTRGRRLPANRVARQEQRDQAIKVASLPYNARGVIWDYIIISVSYPNTFESGVTYFFDWSVYTGDPLTFQPNCILKFASGNYALSYGGIVCNGTASNPSIFTSKDDDLYGEKIYASTGTPTYSANPAIWVYYVDNDAQITGLKVRWAQRAVEIDSNVSSVANTFQDSWLEQCQTGLYAVNCNFSIASSYKCGVQTPTDGAPYYPYSFSGSFSDGCYGDTDSDGLPDSWEMQYFGTLAYNGADDPDGDGINNTQEYQSGTNPTTATPLPEPNFNLTIDTEIGDIHYVSDYSWDADCSDPYRITVTTSWADRVRKGTVETWEYHLGGTTVFLEDWRQDPPMVYEFTNNVQAWSGELSGEFAPGSYMYYSNVSGYGDACDPCPKWWSYSGSSKFWLTPTNHDGIQYVYALSPVINSFIEPSPTNCESLGPQQTNYATITVGGYPVNTDGTAYLSLENWHTYDVTPRDSSLNDYQYGLYYDKYQAPYDPYLFSSGLVDPDFPTPGLLKYGANGVGYNSSRLLQITNIAGTQFAGIAATNSAGDIGILADIVFQVPNITNFNTGWVWHQDVHAQYDLYDPIKDTNQVFHIGRQGWTPNAPSANGNDDYFIAGSADTTIDSGRYIYCADSPGIPLGHAPSTYGALHTGSIISLRFAARTWPTWNGAVMSNLAKWHMTLTVKVTSALGASSVRAKVLNATIGTGATMTPMTLQEARQYYNQP